MTNADWTRLADAAALAFGLHATQRRKGSDVPYISHLMAVSGLVLEHHGDEDQAIAGLLHDVIEDCGAEHEAPIRARFGDRVARIVRACSDTDVTPKPPWRARKDAYLAHLETTDADVLLVSACDKLHNARCLLADLRTHGHAVFDRFTAPRQDTLWYYGALARVFARRLPGPLSRDLAATVAELERLAAA